MRRSMFLLIDLCLIAFATVCALLLRDNFEVSEARLAALVPHLLFTLAVAASVIPALGINRTIWRFATLTDYLRILTATILSVAGAVVIGFAFNRLDGIARALPFLQGLLMLLTLTAARISMRMRHAARGQAVQLMAQAHAERNETVLVVGLSMLTEFYLRSVAEFAPNRVIIAGLLGRNDRHTGRFVHRCPILGIPENVASVLCDLDVHGVYVERIVVTVAFDKLSLKAQEALLDIEKTTNIRLDFIADSMGLDDKSKRATEDGATQTSSTDRGAAFSISALDLVALARRPYWWIKRASDIAVALVLLVVLAPVMLLAAILVAIDVGLPVEFWQQRPGLGGRPFRLLKLRTMTAAHDGEGWRVPDSARVSAVGRFLRRTRLDELPQLYSILVGEMSFVGPRPLLPVDQPAEYAARLLVRPGLTGWAQVKGGREISAADKAALDIWYVRNASLALDLEILARTVPMVIFGERANVAAIQQAWRELQQTGICRSRELAAEQSCLVASGIVTGTKQAA